MLESKNVKVEGAQTRPQLIVAHVFNVDVDDYKYESNNAQIRKIIFNVNEMLN